MTTAQCCIQPQKPFCSFFSSFFDFYYFKVGLLKFTNILFFFFLSFWCCCLFVCFLLILCQGVVLSKLVEDFFNMKEEILSRDFDLGFSGNSEDVVMRALHLLGNCLNVTSSSNRNGEFTIAPSQTVPALFELNFYSNGLFHVFISDAIIGKLCQQYYVLFWFIIVVII